MREHLMSPGRGLSFVGVLPKCLHAVPSTEGATLAQGNALGTETPTRP